MVDIKKVTLPAEVISQPSGVDGLLAKFNQPEPTDPLQAQVAAYGAAEVEAVIAHSAEAVKKDGSLFWFSNTRSTVAKTWDQRHDQYKNSLRQKKAPAPTTDRLLLATKGASVVPDPNKPFQYKGEVL